MRWWKTVSGSVIGDAALDYVSALCVQGIPCIEASDLPGEARDRLDALYLASIGRSPTDEKLSELLAFGSG